MTQLGDGAGTGYPTAIDTRQVYSNVPSPLPDGSSRMDAEALNDVLAALIALETELGVLPKGTFASVAARLAAAQIPAFTLAGLPAPGTAGRLARVTDGGAVDSIVVENGSNWRSIYSRNTRILVVTDPQFGAVGDGSTNDRAAIQAALDALPSTGGVVLIPGGLTYNLGSGLTLTKSNVEIIAYGAILKATAATFNVITIGSDVSGALSNIAIRGATIHGAATDETSASAMITNDSTSAHSRIVVSDCTISGPSGSTGFVRGIVFVDISDSLLTRNSFINVVGTTASDGIHISGASHRNRIIDNLWSFPQTAGRQLLSLRSTSTAAPSSNYIAQNVFIGGSGGSGASGGSQIVILGSNAFTPKLLDNVIINNVFRDYNGASTEALEAAIEIGGNTENFFIAFNSITNSARHGMVIGEDGTTDTARNHAIVGNMVYKNKRHGLNIRGGRDYLIAMNQVFENSQEAVGTYNGIFIDTDGSTATQRARVIGNHSFGTVNQRQGITISGSSPVPTNTFLVGNAVPTNQNDSVTDSGMGTSWGGNVILNSSNFQTNVDGISTTGIRSRNLRGSATFATAATVAVSFGASEPNTSYFISLSGNVNETFWVTAKTTTGFTLNSSNATSTATVDWHLIR